MTYFSSPDITSWQKQIIIGTILGGSSLVKPSKGRNCYLFMRSKNRNWLLYKAEELKNLSSQRPFTEEGNTLRWHSNCYPIFNEFRDAFYVHGKKSVSMPILDQLRDIGLAIWFGDCGRIKGNCIWLNTHKFGRAGSQMVAKYFNEVGIGADVATERKNLRVSLTVDGTQRFLATVAHQLPDFVLKNMR